MSDAATVLTIIAGLLAFGHLLDSKGRSLLGWAVLCLAIIHALGPLPTNWQW
jgi:hypothetical protein